VRIPATLTAPHRGPPAQPAAAGAGLSRPQVSILQAPDLGRLRQVLRPLCVAHDPGGGLCGASPRVGSDRAGGSGGAAPHPLGLCADGPAPCAVAAWPPCGVSSAAHCQGSHGAADGPCAAAAAPCPVCKSGPPFVRPTLPPLLTSGRLPPSAAAASGGGGCSSGSGSAGISAAGG
jgi:hypothetical protein